MRPDELKMVQNFYDRRYQENGNCVKSVGWGTRGSQELRFDVLFRGVNVTEANILDVGCGLGDLASYLDKKADSYNYIGVDVSNELLKGARQKFSSRPNIEFHHSDILGFDYACCKIDYSILSGVLTYKISDNLSYAKEVLLKLYEVSNRGVCANFLTKYADYEDEKNFHYDPVDIFAYCKSISKKVNLYHDYPLYEFTIQMFK